MSDKEARHNQAILYLPLLVFALSWPYPGLAGERGPSFDCSRAGTVVERTICAPENSALQMADSELAERYRQLRSELQDGWSQWLRDSQRVWLKWRDQQCLDNNKDDLGACLLEHYRARNNELALGIISRPVLVGELPFRLALPDGREGEFLLETFAMHPPGGGEGEQQQLFFRTDTGEQQLWEGISFDSDGAYEHNSLEWVTITLLADRRVVLGVAQRSDEYAGGYAELRRQVYHYMTLDPEGQVTRQGVYGFGLKSEYDVWARYRHRWLSGSGDIRLQLSARHGSVHDRRYLSDTVEQQTRQLRFDGRPWDAVPNEKAQWLEEPDGAKRFLAYYDGLMAAHNNSGKHAVGLADRCVANGHDYTLAAQGLAQWLDIVRTALDDGVAYGDGQAILDAVLAGGKLPTLSAGQRELFKVLDAYRHRLEQLPDWQRDLGALYRTLDGHEWQPVSWQSNELADYLGDQGLPPIEAGCVAGLAVPGYDALPFDDWLVSFWVRRYGDGSYNLAAQLIDALGAEPE